jgi:O-antigen/teichoic acid export membrane protein
MIREISADRKSAMSIAGNTLVLKILFSSAALLLSVLFILFSSIDPLTRKVLFLFSPYILFSNLNLTLWYIGDGYQKMEYRGFFTVAYYCCRTVGGWLVLKYTPDIIALFVFLLSVEAVFFIGGFLFTGVFFGRIKLNLETKKLKQIVSLSFPFAVSSILLIFLLRMDIILLNALKGEEAVGLYSPAQKLVGLLLLFSSAFTGAAYPAMSQSSKINADKGYALFIRAVKLMFFAGTLFAFLTTIIAGPIIKIIFGKEYIVSIGVLRILVWMCPPFFSASLFWILFAVKNFQHWTTFICSCGIVVSFGLNFYFVKQMSYLGSALAMVIFSFFLLILSFTIYYGNRKKLFNLQ